MRLGSQVAPSAGSPFGSAVVPLFVGAASQSCTCFILGLVLRLIDVHMGWIGPKMIQ
jgi:hypothetical protein